MNPVGPISSSGVPEGPPPSDIINFTPAIANALFAFLDAFNREGPQSANVMDPPTFVSDILNAKDPNTNRTLSDIWNHGKGDLNALASILNKQPRVPNIGYAFMVLPITQAEFDNNKNIFTPDTAKAYLAYFVAIVKDPSQDPGLKQSVQDMLDVCPGDDDDNSMGYYYNQATDPSNPNAQQALNTLTSYLNRGCYIWESNG